MAKAAETNTRLSTKEISGRARGEWDISFLEVLGSVVKWESTQSRESGFSNRHEKVFTTTNLVSAGALNSDLAMVPQNSQRVEDNRVSDRQFVCRNNNFAGLGNDWIKCPTPALLADNTLTVFRRSVLQCVTSQMALDARGTRMTLIGSA